MGESLPAIGGTWRLLALPHRQPEKRSAVLACESHPPPQLGHTPSPAPAQSCRPGTGCRRVAPEVRGGAGAERARRGGRSPTPLAAQRLQQPDQDGAETPTRDRFSRGFSSEGAAEVSGSSAPPGTMGLSGTRSLQTSAQTESAYGLRLALRVRVTVVLTAFPAPAWGPCPLRSLVVPPESSLPWPRVSG